MVPVSKKAIIYLLWYPSTPVGGNRAFNQRVMYLSRRNEVVFLTGKRSKCDETISSRVTLFRSAFALPRLPLLRRLLDMLFFQLWCTYKVLAHRKKGNTSIVYTFQSHECLAGFVLHLFGLAWVVDVLDLPELYSEAFSAGFTRLALRLYARLSGSVFKYADLVITTAFSEEQGFAKVLTERYKVPREKLLAVPNGVDMKETVPNPEPRCRTPEGAFVVTYVGAVSPMRGSDTMIEVARKLKDIIPSLRLVLVGPITREQGYADTLTSKIKTMDLNSTVVVKGEVTHNEVKNILSQSDVCVHPFPRRGFLDFVLPIKLFEYLAMGKVVVASKLTSVQQIIQHGVNGLLVEPDDIDGWVQSIASVYHSEELRARLEANARPSVEKFDWNGINAKVEQRVLSLVEK